MTDESDLLRRLLEDEIDNRLRYRPSNEPLKPRQLAQEIAEEVIRRLRNYGVSVVGLHTNPSRGEDD